MGSQSLYTLRGHLQDCFVTVWPAMGMSWASCSLQWCKEVKIPTFFSQWQGEGSFKSWKAEDWDLEFPYFKRFYNSRYFILLSSLKIYDAYDNHFSLWNFLSAQVFTRRKSFPFSPVKSAKLILWGFLNERGRLVFQEHTLTHFRSIYWTSCHASCPAGWGVTALPPCGLQLYFIGRNWGKKSTNKLWDALYHKIPLGMWLFLTKEGSFT